MIYSNTESDFELKKGSTIRLGDKQMDFNKEFSSESASNSQLDTQTARRSPDLFSEVYDTDIVSDIVIDVGDVVSDIRDESNKVIEDVVPGQISISPIENCKNAEPIVNISSPKTSYYNRKKTLKKIFSG